MIKIYSMKDYFRGVAWLVFNIDSRNIGRVVYASDAYSLNYRSGLDIRHDERPSLEFRWEEI